MPIRFSETAMPPTVIEFPEPPDGVSWERYVEVRLAMGLGMEESSREWLQELMADLGIQPYQIVPGDIVTITWQ